MTTHTAVLDIGGTHVTAALVDHGTWTTVAGSRSRLALDPSASSTELIRIIATALSTVEPLAGVRVGVAIPGPFDYERGIGDFRGVDKFTSLRGVDVGAALTQALSSPPDRFVFLNDAAAYGIGEYRRGALAGHRRGVALTLGTGIGSAFVADGTVVTTGPDVPPAGRADLLSLDGQQLEHVVSQRALLAEYHRLSGQRVGDVATLAALAWTGDHAAAEAFAGPLTALGLALAPWLARFDAQALVLGGGIAAAHDLIVGPLRTGLGRDHPQLQTLPILRSDDPEQSVEVGAAWHAWHPE